jgi:predicted GNAT family acetyltransferase
MNVANDPAAQRYVITVDGVPAGYVLYRDEPGRRVFLHTQVDGDWSGHGVGSTLARSALDDTRAAGLEVVPRCPFVREFIERHNEYRDLVAPKR